MKVYYEMSFFQNSGITLVWIKMTFYLREKELGCEVLFQQVFFLLYDKLHHPAENT